MTISVELIVFPEGDAQEARVPLRINQIVDINGYPLDMPLRSAKIIAYRVFKITKREDRGEESTFYHLELVRRNEILEYM